MSNTIGTQYVRKGEAGRDWVMKKGEESSPDITLLSLSVGSIISVPGTGHDIVGALDPLSIRRLATSSGSMPAVFCKTNVFDYSLHFRRGITKKQTCNNNSYLKASQVHNEFMGNCSIDTAEKNGVVILRSKPITKKSEGKNTYKLISTIRKRIKERLITSRRFAM